MQLGFPSMTSALPHVKAGKLKAFAITTKSRSTLAPAIPTMNEAGVRGYEASIWNGILVPAGTPGAIVNRLHEAIVQILKSPQAQERYANVGAEIRYNSPDEFRALIAAEIAKWGKVIRAAAFGWISYEGDRYVVRHSAGHREEMHMSSVASLSGARTGWKGSEIDYREHGLHVFSEAELAEIERALRHRLALPRCDFTDVTPESFPLERLGDYMRGSATRYATARASRCCAGYRASVIPRTRWRGFTWAWARISGGRRCSRLPVTCSATSSTCTRSSPSRAATARAADSSCTSTPRTCATSWDSCACARRAPAGEPHRQRDRGLPGHRAPPAGTGRGAARGLLLPAQRRGRQARDTHAESASDRRVRRDCRRALLLFRDGLHTARGRARLAADAGAQEALKEVERLASSPEFYLDMEFAEGDIQFLNNRVTFHGRTDYQDRR
jgi:hypothetical protein